MKYIIFHHYLGKIGHYQNIAKLIYDRALTSFDVREFCLSYGPIASRKLCTYKGYLFWNISPISSLHL